MKRKTKLPFGLSDPYVREKPGKKNRIAKLFHKQPKPKKPLGQLIGVYPVTFKQGGPQLIRWIMRRLGRLSERRNRSNPEREYRRQLEDKYDRQESSFHDGEMVHGPTSSYWERDED